MEEDQSQHIGAANSEGSNKNPRLYAFLYTIKEWIANWKMPCGGKLVRHWMDKAEDTINTPKSQRVLVLVTVCIALLLDNMLYMVIVPIIPAYLSSIGEHNQLETVIQGTTTMAITSMRTTPFNLSTTPDSRLLTAALTEPVNNTFTRSTKMLAHAYKNKSKKVGVLFACKAIFQLLVNPLSGTLMDRIGYDIPMMVGLTIIFFSTMMFAVGQSYGALFVARSMQGVGSAFADTSGFAMIADRYKDDAQRSAALGFAQAFISFGSLVAPPFGGSLYEFAGKAVPFVLLALLALFDGCLMLFSMKPVRKARKELNKDHKLPKGTPIYKLIIDPYIATCAGCLVMANVSLAFIEPTIADWMQENMHAEEWQIGLIWLPAFIPHITGVFLTVKLAAKYPNKQWLMASVGLAMEGISCLIIPFCKQYGVLIVPLCVLCFGIALVDTAILPLMGHLVDVRHVSVYGSVYAIADISYSTAYALGPIVAGQLVNTIGFKALNIAIFVSNILYAPILAVLRKVYDYHKFEPSEEENDAPMHKLYQTYTASSEDDGYIAVDETAKYTETNSNLLNHLQCSDTSDADDEPTERTALRGAASAPVAGGLAGEMRAEPLHTLSSIPSIPIPKPRRVSFDQSLDEEHCSDSGETSNGSESSSESDY